MGIIELNDYNEHILMKDEAQIEKNEAKESANDSKIVICMGLQSVLLCPKIQASIAYYKCSL